MKILIKIFNIFVAYFLITHFLSISFANDITLVEHQILETDATGIEYFVIDSETYLSLSFYNNDLIIYKWKDNLFQPIQTLKTYQAINSESFLIDGNIFLAVTNRCKDGVFKTDSEIFKWDGSKFIHFQYISTNGANDWEFFTIENEKYLAVANWANWGETESIIYKWTGTDFKKFSSITGTSIVDIESFNIEGETYLIFSGNNSKIYKYVNNNLQEIQSICPEFTVSKTHYFTINNEYYLAVIVIYKEKNNFEIQDSKIYKRQGETFKEIQSIKTRYSLDAETFTISNETYLAVTNRSYTLNSKIYKFNEKEDKFIETLSISGIYPWRWLYIPINNNNYLVLTDNRSESKLFKIVEWNNSQCTSTILPVSKLTTFEPGKEAKADEVNNNFDILKTKINELSCQVELLKSIVCKDHPEYLICQ